MGATVHAALFNKAEQKINPATDDALQQVGSGTKTVADVSGGAEALTATATACKYVIISAPVTQATGAATNTKICLIGNSDAQKIKLHHTDIDGVKIECEDAADVYVLPGVDGEGVDWVAFG